MSEQRKLATFMFTDMVGYSALAQKNESLAVDLLAQHRQILRSIFAAHSGQELDAVGDGFLVEFSSAVDATRCAVEIQHRLADRNASVGPDRRFQVRIGLHLGDVVVREGRAHGDGVNIAARIEPLAAPGGVCLSEDVARQVQNKIDTPLQKLGKGELKNIDLPVDIYRVVLPWERRRLAVLQRVAFGLHRKATRRLAVGIFTGLVVLSVAGVSIWRSADRRDGALRTGKSRIAVLPFANISAGAKDDYFADGMTEELISRLSQVRGLDVIARTSVMQYKGKGKSVADIGRELNVETVLEGSVRKAGDKLRITVQLINAGNQGHLWSQNYDRELKDVFAIQSDIAQRIAQALKVQLGASELGRIEKHGTENLEAHNVYLLGRHEFNKFTEEGFQRAVSYYEQAIQKDPTYALPYSGLADSYHLLGGWGYVPSSEAIPKAKAAALRALELDSTLGDALATLAYVRFWYDRDSAGAERDFRQALTLSPNARTQFLWGLYLEFMGRSEEAIREIARARDLDPLSMIINANVGLAYYCARQYERAIDEYRRVLRLDPSFAVAHWWLGWAYARRKMYEDALAEGRKFAELERTGPVRDGILGYLYAVSGHRDEAVRALHRLEQTSRQQYGTQFWTAFVYLGLGDRDRAIELYQAGLGEHSEGQMLLKVLPDFDPLRSDPRFIALLKKLGLEK